MATICFVDGRIQEVVVIFTSGQPLKFGVQRRISLRVYWRTNYIRNALLAYWIDIGVRYIWEAIRLGQI
jgi:hypothetical protein